MKSQSKQNVAKSFQDLRRLLTETSEGMEDHVHTKLCVGDVWSIPDEVTGFSHKNKHPWVIIREFKKRQRFVSIAPRTTKYTSHDDGKRGIVTPSNLIDGLDKEGLILFQARMKLTPEEFRDFIYLGRLPSEWCDKITQCLQDSIKTPGKSNA